MVDIDHFKKINDTQGHQKGDEVLIEVAKILISKTRGNAYRYGGEEFALLLTTSDVSHVRTITNRIRKNILDTVNEKVSMGVSMKQRKDSVATVIKRADLALYEAKEKGRDRTYVHDGSILVDLNKNKPVNI
jgi:diguanylate cyclase (GGDEF)-like protein